ncbi:DUF2336 domain-containing protein [Rhizobium sp. CC1099]|uniref:DUF2336 domain-containing protein n=1 Tax=Rhizobium sp. CC1099 TaxID=3039160 RepID=UPI0024B08F71|nr:DUF2336 domain-containing protein [Rhizobium sp. CC1099]WFU88286.1 DUF2336 domain-containing protein [Rhizobium sp. CC1099]
MRDRFRDLEGPLAIRKKDVVLMATVSSFEGLAHPTRSELRQFAELFMPLFQASSDEARRQAVAALSQCKTIPSAVALFIGSQPIAIAAPFLTASQAVDDDTLIVIARSQGAAHARAIVSRDSLSPKVIDALVALRQAEPRQTAPAAVAEEPAEAHALPPTAASMEAADFVARLASEEAMRERIKGLARHLGRNDGNRLGLRTLSDMQEALLVRFARAREAGSFATALADALSASRWLAERIMLDLSGQQLATTLTSLGMGFLDAVFVLERLYPHLSEPQHNVTRAWMVMDGLDPDECHQRVEAWRRADSYTYKPEDQVPAEQAAASAPRAMRQEPPARDSRIVGRR